jgi:hypothetical protein
MEVSAPESLENEIGTPGIMQGCYMTHFHTYTGSNNVSEMSGHTVEVSTPEFYTLTVIEPFPDEKNFKPQVYLNDPFVCQSMGLTRKFLPIFKEEVEV